MDFEYDLEKSKANMAKYGIDFAEAEALWDDPYLLEVAARTSDEPRFLAIGRIGTKHWSAVFTWRDGTIRLISVHRSRRQEIEYYEG